MLQIKDLHKRYELGGQTVRALDGVTLTINEGEFLQVIGTSGSGKSTLLNLMAGLDTPSSGTIFTPRGDLSTMSSGEIASYRAIDIGMVFQAFNLIPYRTARQNIEMGMLFHKINGREKSQRTDRMLEQLGLHDRANHRPAALSGGEQQRVALGRALVKEPTILLADEPTGNLDKETSLEIARLFGELHNRGLTIVLVTHDSSLASDAITRSVRVNYGRLVAESGNDGND